MYCVKVYLRNIWSDDRTDTGNSSGLPSYHTSSLRTSSAKAVYQRVKKVLWLQWRSIMIVIFLLVDIIFLAIVWVQLDNAILSVKQGKLKDFMPFLVCLYGSGGVKNKCFSLGQEALVTESTAIATLMLLSVSLRVPCVSQSHIVLILFKLAGVQTGLMMSRTTMFVGWYELFMRKFGAKREFVSLDAKRFSNDARTFELLKVGSPSTQPVPEVPATPEIFQTGGRESAHSPPAYGPPGSAHSERAYRKPTLSFSGPRAPSSQGGGGTDWATEEETFARGGLRSHPPTNPPPPTHGSSPKNI
jgi:hypothetical protein